MTLAELKNEVAALPEHEHSALLAEMARAHVLRKASTGPLWLKVAGYAAAAAIGVAATLATTSCSHASPAARAALDAAVQTYLQANTVRYAK